jgi:hypothetical protein
MTGSTEPRPFSQVPASGISILERREIEARIVGPLIAQFAKSWAVKAPWLSCGASFTDLEWRLEPNWPRISARQVSTRSPKA